MSDDGAAAAAAPAAPAGYAPGFTKVRTDSYNAWLKSAFYSHPYGQGDTKDNRRLFRKKFPTLYEDDNSQIYYAAELEPGNVVTQRELSLRITAAAHSPEFQKDLVTADTEILAHFSAISLHNFKGVSEQASVLESVVRKPVKGKAHVEDKEKYSTEYVFDPVERFVDDTDQTSLSMVLNFDTEYIKSKGEDYTKFIEGLKRHLLLHKNGESEIAQLEADVADRNKKITDQRETLDNYKAEAEKYRKQYEQSRKLVEEALQTLQKAQENEKKVINYYNDATQKHDELLEERKKEKKINEDLVIKINEQRNQLKSDTTVLYDGLYGWKTSDERPFLKYRTTPRDVALYNYDAKNNADIDSAVAVFGIVSPRVLNLLLSKKEHIPPWASSYLGYLCLYADDRKADVYRFLDFRDKNGDLVVDFYELREDDREDFEKRLRRFYMLHIYYRDFWKFCNVTTYTQFGYVYFIKFGYQASTPSDAVYREFFNDLGRKIDYIYKEVYTTHPCVNTKYLKFISDNTLNTTPSRIIAAFHSSHKTPNSKVGSGVLTKMLDDITKDVNAYIRINGAYISEKSALQLTEEERAILLLKPEEYLANRYELMKHYLVSHYMVGFAQARTAAANYSMLYNKTRDRFLFIYKPGGKKRVALDKDLEQLTKVQKEQKQKREAEKLSKIFTLKMTKGKYFWDGKTLSYTGDGEDPTDWEQEYADAIKTEEEERERSKTRKREYKSEATVEDSDDSSDDTSTPKPTSKANRVKANFGIMF